MMIDLKFVGGRLDGANGSMKIVAIDGKREFTDQEVAVVIKGYPYTVNVQTGVARYTPLPDSDVEVLQMREEGQ